MRKLTKTKSEVKKMKSKFSKIFLLITALTLILGVCFAITASAEGETEAKPEIISKNIYYTDVLSIMYAVDADTVAEGAVTLKVYTENPETAENPKATAYVAEAPQTEKINGEEKSVYVFITDGVCVKDMADFFYAQATDSEGNKSDVYTYSVVEYMLERLYGGKTVTDAQKRTYEAALEFGAASQALLCPEDEIKVDDYKYVRVEGGTANGVEKGMFVEGTELTLVRTAEVPAGSFFWGWNVTVGGETVLNKTLTTLALDDNTVISADISSDGSLGYFDTYGGYDFTGLTNVYSQLEVPLIIKRNMSCSNTANQVDHATYTNAYLNYAAVDENTVLALGVGGGKTWISGGTPGFACYIPSGTGDCYVFESDVYFGQNNLITDGYAALSVSFFDTNETSVEHASNAIATSLVKDDGTRIYEIFGYEILPESWINIGVKYYSTAGLVEYYLNGRLVSTATVEATEDAMSYVRVFMNQYGNQYVYFDNMYFGVIDTTNQ